MANLGHHSLPPTNLGRVDEEMASPGLLPVKVITDHAALTKLMNGKNSSSGMVSGSLKLAEFNVEWEHHPGAQNVVADLLSRNPVESIADSKIFCAVIRSLMLSSREQLIEEQMNYHKLGRIYRFLENPEDSSVNAAICENRFHDFRRVDNLLFYAK
ncbi:hypothetical protein TNCV_1400761 [Trichonephila clavipes]|nr:hypothetical protein TNCV_1400761 [Trichonephila clavipes]